MGFWSRFFLDEEITEIRDAPNLPSSDIHHNFISSLNKERLKIDATINFEGVEYTVPHSATFFGSGSAFDCDLMLDRSGEIRLVGEIALYPFYRLWFQCGLTLAAAASLLMSGLSFAQWIRSGDLQQLEVFGAGIAAIVLLVLGVRGIAALNYLSTRREKAKIVHAFQTF